MEKRIFSFGGPCAAGKDTIAKALIERFDGKVTRFPRTTSRAPRSEERDGVEYNFVSQNEFKQKADQGRIVAVDSAGVAWYGIDIHALEDKLANCVPENILIVGGICGIGLRKFFPKMVNIYITAEIDELVKRLFRRGHRDDDFYQRVKWIHRQIIEEPSLFDITVRNPEDRLEETIETIERIIGFRR